MTGFGGDLVPRPLAWRVLVDPPLPGPVNMARDHALALGTGEGEGVLRLYRWSAPTVSFGRNEPARGLYNQERARTLGVEFVRRPTGGRAVLHHLELTYSVVFPLGALGGLRTAYRAINRGLLAGLRRLGASVALAPPSGRGALPPGAGPCFREPAEGEVTALGHKLIGSAQVRLGGRVLQHGSLVLDGDQELLRDLRGDPEPVPSPATLRALLGELPGEAPLQRALQEGLEEVLGGEWGWGEWSVRELGEARGLEGVQYGDPGWTWRC